MISSSAMQQSADLVRQGCPFFKPEIAIILGSGLGRLSEHLHAVARIPYTELSIFPQRMVSGHHAELLIGELFGRKVLLFCGRFHVYQGLSSFDSTLPVQLARELGCRGLLLTCAVGGIGDGIQPGDFLLVNDHLNFSGTNPLQGLTPPAFIDLHDCYRHEFLPSLKVEADKWQRTLHSGVLAYMTGPSYETPAEITALRVLGAAAVSMSTVTEAIMGRALGLQIAALALVTNLAGGSVEEKLSHQDVLSCSADAAKPFSRLVETLLAEFLSD